MAELYHKGIISEENGVAEWIAFIDKAYQAEHGHPSPLHDMYVVEQPGDEALEPDFEEAEAIQAEAPPESAPAEVRKAKRLEREQQFDVLPNVLDGLDPFQALFDTAETGFFERAFTGTPMVVDRLVTEAGEADTGTEDGNGESQNRNYGTGTGFAAALTSVVKGNLVFSNVSVFKIVQQRRYNARAMMKLMGTRPDRHLPDIQVLAPHEFGQVPGFVAGQYRGIRDRLCTVMVTYDPALWELTLRERKLLIESSKAPKLYVFPRQWLFDLSSAYKWYDAGWFGTPKDPSILDFVIPNGNYDI
jgi:hypothetical protein